MDDDAVPLSLPQHTPEFENLVVSLVSWLQQHESTVHPVVFRDYLNILQNIQQNFGSNWSIENTLAHQKIHSFFQSVLNSAYDENVLKEFNSCCTQRRDFLPDSDFFPDVHRPQIPSKYELSSLPIQPVPSTQELASLAALQHATSKNFTERLEKHSDLLISLKKYLFGIRCYYWLLIFIENKEKKREIYQKIRRAEIAFVTDHKKPESLMSILEDPESWPFPNYSQNFEPIIEVIDQYQQDGITLLNGKKYEDGIIVLKSILLFIQGENKFLKLKGKDSEEISKREREIFEIFCLVHLNKFECNYSHLSKPNYKKILKGNRKRFFESKNIMNWNFDFIGLIKLFVADIFTEIGDGPFISFQDNGEEKRRSLEFAILSIGSIGRKEACVFSDIDLLIVVEDRYEHTPEMISYFRTFCILFEMKALSLGEASLPPIDIKWIEKKPLIGIHLDPAGYFPVIADKEEDNRSFGRTKDILSFPKRNLVDGYGAIQDFILLNKNGQQVFEKFQNDIFRENTIQQIAIVEEFQKTWMDFQFKIDQHSSKSPINVKNLIRFIYLMVNRLAMFYEIDKTHFDSKMSTTEFKIRQLCQRKNHEADFSKNYFLKVLILKKGKLIEYFNFLIRLRFNCHQFYKSGDPSADLFYLQEFEKENVFFISEKEKIQLMSYFESVLEPIYEALEFWFKLLEIEKKYESILDQKISKESLERGKMMKKDNELSCLLFEVSVRYLKRFAITKKLRLRDLGNWFFEKAVELNYVETYSRWKKSILVLLSDRKTSVTLEFVDENSRLQEISLSQTVINQLEDKNNFEQAGRRNVIRIEIDGNFFHLKEYPESPFLEFAVSSLSHLIFGYTSTPFSMVGKLNKNGVMIPVILSRTVLGDTMKKDQKDEIFNIADPESFSISFFRTLLTNPNDDQPENFLFQHTLSPFNDQKKTRLFCVDNDHGFLDQTQKKFFFGGETMLLNSVVYLSSRMETEIESKSKEKIEQLNAFEKIETWLNLLNQMNHENVNILYKNNVKQLSKIYKVKTEKSKESFETTIGVELLLPSKIGITLFQKFFRIQQLLSDGYLNYIGLLKRIEPEVGKHYEIQMKKSNQIISNFYQMTEGQYQKVTGHNWSSYQTMKEIVTDTFTNKPSILIENFFLQKFLFEECVQIRKDILGGIPVKTSIMSVEMKEIILNGTSLLSIQRFMKEISLSRMDIVKKELSLFNFLMGSNDSYFSKRFKDGIQRLDLSYSSTLNGYYLENILTESIIWLDISHLNINTKNPFSIDLVFSKCKYIEVLYIDIEFFNFRCETIPRSLKKICFFNIPEENRRKRYDQFGLIQEKGGGGVSVDFSRWIERGMTLYQMFEMIYLPKWMPTRDTFKAEDKYRMNITLLGTTKSGRTQLFNRWKNGSYDNDGGRTKGVDTFTKSIARHSIPLIVEVWDTPAFYPSAYPHPFLSSCCKVSNTCIITFNITEKQGLKEIKLLQNFINESAHPGVPIFLVGTFYDEPIKEYKISEIRNYAKENNLPLHFISSKTNLNLDQLFEDSYQKIVKEIKMHQEFLLTENRFIGTGDFGPQRDCWKKLLSTELNAMYFHQIKSFLTSQRAVTRVYPPPENVFAAFDTTPLDNVKVVIIGHDPYCQEGLANGLCFSVPKFSIHPNLIDSGFNKTPPSLSRIYKVLERQIDGFHEPSHGDLTYWAHQGVLLLNASLTVERGKPDSHAMCWRPFTDAVLRKLNDERKGLVFMLWGPFAQKKGSVIDSNKHYVLTHSHSPCAHSYHSSSWSGDEWFSCRHFEQCNKLLESQGKKKIDWTLPEV